MSEDEIKAYHSIITELEAPRIAGIAGNINEGEWYSINNVKCLVTYEELKDFLKNKGFNNPDSIIKSLIGKGFLVQLPLGKADYQPLRSLHMDILVRSSQITTMHGNPPYILSYKFAITRLKVPVKGDRTIIPGGNNPSWNKLQNAILFFFNNNSELANIYTDILKEYLSRRGTGLDGFQAYVLREMLSSDKSTYAIVAPTGSGKTEIYLFYSLAMVMKWRLLENDKRKKVLLVYPRKALTIDQAYRITELLSIANDKLARAEYSITFGIRDGDTPVGITTSRQQRDLRLVERGEPFRGVACPHCKGGQLAYESLVSVVCKSCNKKIRLHQNRTENCCSS
jgi:DEAD/DEAH box helicase domain-containing protein